jgi:hypothetical protein
MQFEYVSVKVEPFLKTKQQPVIGWDGMKPKHTYYVLQQPEDGGFALATTNSQIARVPVFALTTNPDVESDLSANSGLMAVLLETTLKFVAAICPMKTPTRAIVLLGTNCHEVNGRYRGYLGLVIEIPN